MTSPEPRAPIADYGFIGDTRSAALVAPDGSIDWLCLPRFDSPPVFGRLVGGEAAGSFSVRPGEPATLEDRSYRGDTVTLETSWRVDGGRVTLSDSMVAEISGRLLPTTLLVRRLVSSGRTVRMTIRISPRFDYDRSPARRVSRRSGALVFEHRGLALALTSDGDTSVVPEAESSFEVHPDHPVTIVLTASHRGPLVLVAPEVARDAATRDEDGWQQWADGITTAPSHRDVVTRSLLTLRLLTYSPSGAPVAAPTTSLPERLGGARNWDYRFAWPRDASIGIGALLAAGKHHDARAFLAWLLHASRLARPRLPALFTLDGRPGTSERTLEGWPGYAGSEPVRVGNGAADQHQLDGYGWVLDAAWLLTASGNRLYGETWRAMARFADHVADTWSLPDAGIWERRDEPRHHVHSKLMAWLALDRAARIARSRGGGRAAARAKGWTEARDALADDLREHGYDDEVGAYTAAYGTRALDAAVLLLPLIDLEPAGSPRIASTIDAIREQLGAGGPLLYRYREEDGLEGTEGAFLPCSFWLVQALALTGRIEEAGDLFEELVELGGPLGLFAEEADPGTGAFLGNYPQALTHSTLLQAAFALQAARDA